MYYQTEAIILKNMDFKETDKLVTFLARKEGKVRAIAKGIKKAGSSLRGPTQPFCHSRIHLSRGRELDLITQGKIIDFYGNIREDLNKMLQAAYLAELLDKSLVEADPHPRLFDTTLSVLQYLEVESFSPLVMRWFEMRLAGELGYRPGLDRCINCHQVTCGVLFSVSDGGILCDQCASGKIGEGIRLDGETLAVLRALDRKELRLLGRVRVSDRTLNVLELLLEKYLEYHLERRFNVKGIIKTIKNV